MNKNIFRLRELAKQVSEIASDPLQQEHARLWTAVNDKQMIHPVALIRDYGLNMLEYNDELSVQIEDDEFLRYYEAYLLAEIYQWRHIRCNSVIEPHIYCPAVVQDTGFGVKIAVNNPPDVWRWQSKKVADHFDGIIKTPEDLDMIKVPEVSYDKDATQEKVNYLNEVFGGILDVKVKGFDNFQFCPWDDLLKLMGLQEGMLNFALQPEFMHEAADKFIDTFIVYIDRLEELGLLNHNNRPVLIGQGGYGYTTLLPDPKGEVMGAKIKDMWGSVTDQILTSVSPEMTNEFAIEHECKWAEKFGLLYYGCCEKLNNKLNYVKKMPHLHKVSVSPYSDRESCMEQLGSDAVVSFKANSVLLAQPVWDKEASRRELIDVCRLARKYNCSVEVLMKTLININGDPKRLWEWSDIAHDVLSNY